MTTFKICPLYRLTEDMFATRNDCYRVVPHKVSTVDLNRLDRDLIKYELFASLISMKNG